MATEIVLRGRGYPISRRWARYRIDLPVVITFRKCGKVSSIKGRGSELNCGGMTIFIPADLEIGDSIAMEFTPPYSGRPVTMIGTVRNCHIYSYGVEFSRWRKRPERLPYLKGSALRVAKRALARMRSLSPADVHHAARGRHKSWLANVMPLFFLVDRLR